MPLMPPIEPVGPVQPIAPASATIEDELLPIPAGQAVAPPAQGTVNLNPNYQRMPPPPGQYRPTNANRRDADDDNSRRARRLQQQEANYRANAQRNDSSESRGRRGLFFRRGN